MSDREVIKKIKEELDKMRKDAERCYIQASKLENDSLSLSGTTLYTLNKTRAETLEECIGNIGNILAIYS